MYNNNTPWSLTAVIVYNLFTLPTFKIAFRPYSKCELVKDQLKFAQVNPKT